MTEWISHPNDNCGDCKQPKSIDLDSGQTRCDTPVCRASAEFSLDDAVDFLGEHFQLIVID
jgi:hypothetical protein